MGGIGKALRRIGFDLSLNDLGNYFEGQRKKKEQQDLYSNLLNAWTKANTNLSGIGEAVNSTTETAKNPFYNPNSILDEPRLGNYNALSIRNMVANKPVGLSALDANVMAKKETETPTYEKTTQTPVPQGEKYKRAQKIIDDFNNSYVQQALNPEADQNQLSKMSVLGRLLGEQAERMRPKTPKIASYNPENDIIDENTGEIIRKGTAKAKPFDIEGSYENKETGTYWTYDKQLGIPIDTKIPYDQSKGKTTVNVGDKSPDYSSDYGTVVTGINEIQKLKKTNLLKKKNGKLEFSEPGAEKSKVFKNEKEFNDYKETKKKEYNTAAVQMLKKYDIKTNRGLLKDNGGAVNEIRKQIKKGKSIDDAIDLFGKYNPDITEEEKDLLKKYFTIHLE